MYIMYVSIARTVQSHKLDIYIIYETPKQHQRTIIFSKVSKASKVSTGHLPRMNRWCLSPLFCRPHRNCSAPSLQGLGVMIFFNFKHFLPLRLTDCTWLYHTHPYFCRGPWTWNQFEPSQNQIDMFCFMIFLKHIDKRTSWVYQFENLLKA